MLAIDRHIIDKPIGGQSFKSEMVSKKCQSKENFCQKELRNYYLKPKERLQPKDAISTKSCDIYQLLTSEINGTCVRAKISK